MSVRIFADSTCDLSADLVEKYGITIIPLYVTLGEDSYKDGVDGTPDMIYEHFDRTQQTPKTAAPTLGDFMEKFAPAVANGDEIVFIGISGQMSACVSGALLAAQEFPGAVIEAVDSQNLSTGIGLVVIKAAEMAAQGKGAAEIAARLREIVPKVRASFVIDTLTYLYRGGRCSALQAFGANALRLKPKIMVENGRMGTGEKYRGKIVKCAKKYARDIIAGIKKADADRVFITSSRCDPEIIRVVDETVRAAGIFTEILHTTAGCVITSHCGPNTIGVLYIEQ